MRGFYFSDFEISKSMTSWRPFCTHSFAALSRSQFCFDCLQNLTQYRKLSSTICYIKSARSICNFRQYGGPRFRKKSKWPPKSNFWNKASEVSISTEIDLLITNIYSIGCVISGQSGKNVKIEKNVKWVNIWTFPW